MRETRHFVNDGRGWECKRCRAEAASSPVEDDGGDAPSSDALPRFFREGEAEEREPRLASPALARWKDASRGALVCPRCGAEEDLSG